MHVLNACWSNKHDWRADWTAHGWSLLGLGWFSAAAMRGAARIQAAAAICHIVDSTRPPLPWMSESAEQETFCEKLTLQAVPRAVCNATGVTHRFATQRLERVLHMLLLWVS